MDDRQLKIIIVPHPDHDLETRTFSISYSKLKAMAIVGVFVGAFIAFIIASWFPVASTASRVPGLKRELEALEAQQADVNKLAKDLADVEAQYKKVRELLGADAPVA